MLPKACAALFPILYLVVAGEEPSLSEHKHKPPLSFRAEPLNDENGNPTGRTRHVFKILQLTDIHYGEGPGTTWGLQQDARSIELIQSLLRAEEPDLVVLSGDNLTADYIKEDASAIQNQLVQAMVEAQSGVRWCLVMGNHDDHPFETFLDDEDVLLSAATTTRGELLTSDAALEGSVTVADDKSMYKLPIFYTADNGTEHDSPAAEIFIFDTGGGSTREDIDQEQVEWFIEQTSSIAQPIPAIAFQHIATNEKAWAFGSECSGTDAEPNKVKTVKNDRGLFEAMLNYEDIFFVGIGHDHGKSYCCNYKKLQLCYGRHSGYGGYGKVDRGGRLYELRLEEGENKQAFSWTSWVRLDDGSIVDRYQPNTVKEYPSPKRRTTVAPTLSPAIGVVDTSATFAPSRASESSSTSGPTHEPSQPLTANIPSEGSAVDEQNSLTSSNDSSTTLTDLGAAADEPSSAANQSRSRWVMSTCAVIPSLLLM